MEKIKKKKIVLTNHTNGNGSHTNGTKTSARLKVQKTYKIYIDGKFPRTESGRYYELKNSSGETIANICNSSRKDFREAVVAARKAQPAWAAKSAYNRGQILYRVSEMLEGRKSQFIDEMMLQGATKQEAENEILLSIDRVLYYAGWSDKYQQIFSSVNPVESSHFNFSVPEATGVVSIISSEEYSLLGLVSVIAPCLAGGNTCILLASASLPLCAVTFAEVLNSSDMPGGVVNILTGYRKELLSHFSSHMDVNAIIYCGKSMEEKKLIQVNASLNVKRVKIFDQEKWENENSQSPYFIMDTQEIKTTWHPIGV